MFKKLLLGVLAALAVVGIYIASLYIRVGNMHNAEQQEAQQLEANQIAYFTQLAAHTKERLAKEAADTYGGTTPEETWALFIKALEAGDTDLATKYFVVDTQVEQKIFFEKEVAGGTLPVLLEALKKTVEGKYSYDNEEYSLYTAPESDGMRFEYTLTINPQTHVWKILSL